MPAAYHFSITVVQGQPHHSLSLSAALPVSAYSIIEDVDCWHPQLLHCICRANICEYTLAAHLSSQELKQCS